MPERTRTVPSGHSAGRTSDRSADHELGRRPDRTGRRALRRTEIALLCAVTIALASCVHGRSPEAPDSPTAATVGDDAITVDDLDDAIRDALFARAFPDDADARLFEARRATLDLIVDDEVVQQAMGSSDLTPEEWLAREVETRMPVTDADIDAFWQQYEHRIPKDLGEEQTRRDIRSYLTDERSKTLVAQLRDEAKVHILLARPRVEVEARGTARGPADAPVTIVEFSDFQCPFCLRVTPTLDALLARYPEQVRLYYRHLPLAGHGRARPAAIASVCAEAQGQFWAYHDLLFENQSALGDEDLRGYAEQLGLDLAVFDACIAGPVASARVDEDVAVAKSLGLTGTPSFFVNGVPMKGAQPVERFVSLIEDEIARAELPGAEAAPERTPDDATDGSATAE